MRRTVLLVGAAVAVAALLSPRPAYTDEEAEGPEAEDPAAGHLGTLRYALVIGIDEYADGDIPNLQSSEDSGRAVLSVLLDPEKGGVPAANAQSLFGADATAAKIREGLDGLRRVPKEATVFVYFAGHGAKEGEDAYWVSWDAKKGDLAATAVADAEVRRLVERIPAERVLLLMDCRHEPRLLGGRRARIDHAEVLSRYHGPRHVTLGAAATQEHASETEGVERSVFTHHLVEGLGGRADADENGVVDLAELAGYVRRRVAIEARKRPGLERPVVDVREPPPFLLTIAPKAFAPRLREDREAQIRRREHLAALTALHGDGKVTTPLYQAGLHLLGVLPEGLTPHEEEQRAMFVDLVAQRLDPADLAGALAAIRRPDRRTLVVPDEFETIQAAIDAARAGDTVFVKAGAYTEHIVFKTGLRLRGEGRQRTVVRMVPGEPEILLVEDCAWGVVEGLQFDGAGGTKIGDWSPDGIHLKQSSVHIRDCVAHNCLGCGLYVDGPKRRLSVRDCRFEDNTHDGLCVGDALGGEIVGCICRSNGAVGIQIRKSGGAISIRACQCERNPHGGIGVSGGSTATLTGNDCRENGGHGILAWEEGTSVTLEGNRCTSNEIHGVFLVQGAFAQARGNVCSRNGECGFLAYGAGTRATLVENRCLDNHVADDGVFGGIVFRDGASGEATSNICEGNARGVLVVGKDASARLRDNTCRGNTTSGIEFREAATGHATGNRCVENRHGITVSNTEATLEGNTLQRNTMHGMFFREGGTSTASENRCEENEHAGIHVTGVGTRIKLLKNTCASNGTHGIEFAHGAGGTADGNECSRNTAFGIVAVHSGTAPILQRNRCTNNERGGIGKQEGATPYIGSDNVEE